MTGGQADPEAVKRTLGERLDALRRASDGAADSRRPVMLDQASVGRLSRMDAMQMQAMAQAAERLRTLEIDRIKAALRRIDDGDFGYCTLCGEAIGPKRLAVDPTIATCIHCASGTEGG